MLARADRELGHWGRRILSQDLPRLIGTMLVQTGQRLRLTSHRGMVTRHVSVNQLL